MSSRGLVTRGYLAPTQSGGGGGSPPEITNIQPAPNTTLFPDTIVSIDIIDPTDTLVVQEILCYYPDGSTAVIFKDGVFKDFRFIAAPNRIIGITNGLRVFMRPEGGWAQQPTLDIAAVDSHGLLAVIV